MKGKDRRAARRLKREQTHKKRKLERKIRLSGVESSTTESKPALKIIAGEDNHSAFLTRVYHGTLASVDEELKTAKGTFILAGTAQALSTFDTMLVVDGKGQPHNVILAKNSAVTTVDYDARVKEREFIAWPQRIAWLGVFKQPVTYVLASASVILAIGDKKAVSPSLFVAGRQAKKQMEDYFFAEAVERAAGIQHAQMAHGEVMGVVLPISECSLEGTYFRAFG